MNEQEAMSEFFHGLAHSEMSLSALLAWHIQGEGAEAFFAAAELAAPPGSEAAEAVALLKDADDLCVQTEAWVGTGDVDIALFSRGRNAVIVLENKLNTDLGKDQLTKYREALDASDPSPMISDMSKRRAAVALVCPPAYAPDTGADFKLTYDNLRKAVADTPGGTPWFVREALASWSSWTTAGRAPGEEADTDAIKRSRREFLETLCFQLEAAGWRCPGKLYDDSARLNVNRQGRTQTGPWTLQLGSARGSLLRLVMPLDDRRRLREIASTEPSSSAHALNAYLKRLARSGKPGSGGGISVPRPFPSRVAPWAPVAHADDAEHQAAVAVHLLGEIGEALERA